MGCCSTLAPVCVLQAVVLIANNCGDLNCVNGAAQEINWLVQVKGPRALCARWTTPTPRLWTRSMTRCPCP